MLVQNILKGFVRSISKYRFSSLASTLETIFNSKPEENVNDDKTGLFGMIDLQNYEDLYEMTEKCVRITEELLKEAVNKERSRKLVEIFDDLSDNLCRVADVSEFVRMGHPSIKFTKAAEDACATVTSLVEKLNTHKELYEALQNVSLKGDKVPTSGIDDHVSKLFLFDFEQSGIHLNEIDRNKIVYLNDTIHQLGQKFTANALEPRRVKKDIIPESAWDFFEIFGNQIEVGSLHSDSPIPLKRELAYKIFLMPEAEQEQILDKLLKSRYELAKTCGFENYAERALKGSLLQNPKNVQEFFNILSTELTPRADLDFKEMKKMKTCEVGSNQLAVWDVPYYIQKHKKEKCKVNTNEYSEYFSLGNCMQGLNLLFNKLFGIKLENVPIQIGEVWAEEVYKLSVVHEEEGLLGYIYCDFYERDNKPSQDSHFTIIGGRVLPSGEYQLPVVVLMLNIPQPRMGAPPLLTPCMVDNLFHEMGHAMHSMLGRTQYQHVTGTRCSTDIAEVPAVLMEYFARDYRVLKLFAKHFKTNNEMPDSMLKQLCNSKHIFKASEMQIQLFYSALDQGYHHEIPIEGNTTKLLSQIHNKFYSIPYVDKTAWQLRFCHLVGYGAKYYAYLVSTAIASSIWQSYFEANPFDRQAGEKLRRDFLAHGGAKPANRLIEDYLQKEPTPKHLSEALIMEIDSNQNLLLEKKEVRGEKIFVQSRNRKM